tara:strand:- start:2611 stop:3186 length:576 start_codon:yes stop_codon:yes gene_type:complete
MRVCIYAQSRSGSTVLSLYVSNQLGLYNIAEPYNPRNSARGRYFPDEAVWLDPGVSVKFLCGELRTDQQESLHKYFDKVVILTRDDDIAGAESHMMGLITRIWEPYKYNLKDFNEEERKKLQYNIKWREETRKQLTNLPYFQVTYEELFYKKVGITRLNSYLNIEQDNSDIDMFDIKHKYRQDPINKKSII